MATAHSRNPRHKKARWYESAPFDLVPVAEAALTEIARECCQFVHGELRARKGTDPDALWVLSVARLLRIWISQTCGTSDVSLFATASRECLDERLADLSQRVPADSPALAAWCAATSSIGRTAAETQAMAQLFQQLQERRWEFAELDAMPHLVRDRGNRRAAGSYFTPVPLIEYIVRETVGPAWQKHWAKHARCEATVARNASQSSRVFAALATFRVVDPACGGGDFLLAALDYLQATVEKLLAVEPAPHAQADLVEQLALCGYPNHSMRSRDQRQFLRWLIAANCLFGVDLDPLAVELTRARIWLTLDLPSAPGDWVKANIRYGNALVDDACDETGMGEPFDWRHEFPQVFVEAAQQESSGFQAVLGNPPFGSIREPKLRKALARRWPQMRYNSDAVVGFVGRAEDLSVADGHLGLVVPKPLTYSFAWRRLRNALYDRLEYCIDVSRAWPEVLLEQVLLGWRPVASRGNTFRGGEWAAGRFRNLHRASRGELRHWGAILCSLRPGERRVLAALERDDRSVGDICRTFRGLPLQRVLRDKGEIPVLGGRDLARWRLRGKSGYLPVDADIDPSAFRRERLVFQNIIAHLKRPAPHIRLIGALDSSGQITLDTVNNLVAREEAVNLRAVLALLHSRLVNWYVFAVVYNKAIRTMHFDQYFLNKIPLPADWSTPEPALAEVAAEAEQAAAAGDESAQRKAEREIDRLVAQAYGVKKNLIDEVI